MAELEKKGKPPSFARASRSKKEGTKTRKKRAASHNQARRREEPTRIERHAVETCAGCGYHLRGKSAAYRRQVVELPEPQPVEVIEHQIVKRWCPVCAAWQQPAVDWSREAVTLYRVDAIEASGDCVHAEAVCDVSVPSIGSMLLKPFYRHVDSSPVTFQYPLSGRYY